MYFLERYTVVMPFVVSVVVIVAACSRRSHELTYPVTRKVDQVDDYHGTLVADPYRWLEDVDSDETKQWVTEENRVTSAYLDNIPERAEINNRLTELWDYPKYGAPFHENSSARQGSGRYFYFKNDGLQNQSVLYRQTGTEGDGEVLLDPNQFSEDGTVALTTLAVSRDSRYLLYGTSASGSDWQEFHVRDIDGGRNLGDHLKWIKFAGGAWTKDARGFFYCRYPEPTEGETFEQANRDMKVYFHRIGDVQNRDELVYELPQHPDWGFSPTVTEDGSYLVLNVWEGTDPKNRIHYIDLREYPRKIVRLLDDFDAGYTFLGNDGATFYFQTDLDAPCGRIIAINIESPSRPQWQEIIPQQREVLKSTDIISNRLVTVYMKDARDVIRIYAKSGKHIADVDLPEPGTVSEITGKPGDTEMFYSFTSFTYPATVFRYDFGSRRSTVYRMPDVDFDPADFTSKQVFYTSRDGTRIPMFITHKKGIRLDGSNPVYLYGYGGFKISVQPSFSVSNIVWMEMGGIYAVPNLRGGGEYGEEWHKQGILDKKQNVFDDFIAAAEFLIREGYTSREKLAIGGGSNGGLLVGACLTQRPELFGAALPAVGVMDMLRFHKFTIGWAWVSDYGSSDDPEQFAFLYAYSPVHNIKKGVHYPATLITTADHDDRVVPGHSFKFAAALQAAQGGGRPVLIRIETKAGHGAGKPTFKIIEEQADKWAFLVKNLGMQ